MNRMTSVKDKRQHPRLFQMLPINVETNGYDFTTSTQNVSCLGAYCTITKYIPPFTRVKVKMSLPVKSRLKKSEASVECEGVVVRSEDSPNGEFNIAIYFNRIAEATRQKLSQYVSTALSQTPSSIMQN